MERTERVNPTNEGADENPFTGENPHFAEAVNDTLRQEVLDLQAKLAEAAKKIEEATNQYHQAKADAANLVLEKERELTTEYNDRLQDEIDKYKESIKEDIREEARRVRDERNDLAANQKDLEDALNSMERDRQELKKDRVQLDNNFDEIERREGEVSEREEALRDREEKQAEREKEFGEYITKSREQFTARMAEADKGIESAMAELEQAKKRIAILSSKEATNQKTLQEREADLVKLGNMLEEARVRIRKLEESERANQPAAKPAGGAERHGSPMQTEEDPTQRGDEKEVDSATEEGPPKENTHARETAETPTPTAGQPIARIEDLLIDPESPPTLSTFDIKSMPSTARHYNSVLEKVPSSVIQSIQGEPLTSLIILPFLANTELMSQKGLIIAWTEFFAHFKGHEDIIIAPSKGPRALTAFNIPRDLHAFLCNARAIIHKPLVAGFVYEINDLAANPRPNIATYTSPSNVVSPSPQRQRQFLEIVRKCLTKDKNVKTAIKNIAGGTGNFTETRDNILASLGVEHTTKTLKFSVPEQVYILTLRVKNIPYDLYVTLLSAILDCQIRENNEFHYDRIPPLDCRICSNIGHYGGICPWVLLEDYLGPSPDTDWSNFLGQQLRTAREAINVGTDEPAYNGDKGETRRPARSGKPPHHNSKGRGGHR